MQHIHRLLDYLPIRFDITVQQLLSRERTVAQTGSYRFFRWCGNLDSGLLILEIPFLFLFGVLFSLQAALAVLALDQLLGGSIIKVVLAGLLGCATLEAVILRKFAEEWRLLLCLIVVDITAHVRYLSTCQSVLVFVHNAQT